MNKENAKLKLFVAPLQSKQVKLVDTHKIKGGEKTVDKVRSIRFT